MTPEDVRALAGSAHRRWIEIELVHRSPHDHIRATLRHGEIDGVRLPEGRRIRGREAPPSSWDVRPVEPYPTNYQWSAMLDPAELSRGVDVSDVRRAELFGRPVVSFVARADSDYDPICPCCPLVFSEASMRLEKGEDWTAAEVELPDGVEIALDLEIGIVVSSRDRGGRLNDWFTNEIVGAQLSSAR